MRLPQGLLLFMALWLCSGAGLWADEDSPITGIRIEGLKRTKAAVAEYPLRRFQGLPSRDLDMNEVRGVVLEQGILDPVSVEIEEGPGGEAILVVVVREKWSIFPLPLFLIGSGGMTIGGVFMDANAFGLNDKALAGGIYSDTGWIILAMYAGTANREGLPGWTGTGFFSREERVDTDQREEPLRRLSLDALDLRGSLSYRVSAFLEGGLSLSYGQRTIRGGDLEEGTIRTLKVNPEASIRRRRWDGYFLSEESAAFSYSYTWGFEYPSFHTLAFQGTYERSIIPGFRFLIRNGLSFAPGSGALFESSPQAVRAVILPSSFRAVHYGGLSGGLEKSILKTSVGILAVSAVYELVWSWSPFLEHQWDQGPAGGITFYLSKVALPALGFTAAYNLAARHGVFAFSMGVRL